MRLPYSADENPLYRECFVHAVATNSAETHMNAPEEILNLLLYAH